MVVLAGVEECDSSLPELRTGSELAASLFLREHGLPLLQLSLNFDVQCTAGENAGISGKQLLRRADGWESRHQLGLEDSPIGLNWTEGTPVRVDRRISASGFSTAYRAKG